MIVPRVTGVNTLLESFEPIHGVLLCEGEDIDTSLYESETSILSPEEWRLRRILQSKAQKPSLDRYDRLLLKRKSVGEMAKEEAKFSDDFDGGDCSVKKREAIMSSSEKAPAVMKTSEKQKDWILFGKLAGGYKKDGGLKKRNRGKKSKAKSKAKAKAVGSKTHPSKEEDEVEKILDMKSALLDLCSRIKYEYNRDRHKEFLEKAKMTVIRVGPTDEELALRREKKPCPFTYKDIFGNSPNWVGDCLCGTGELACFLVPLICVVVVVVENEMKRFLFQEESDESYDYPRHFYCCQKPGSWLPSESESDSDSIP
ncbi:hypothetical protein L1887_23854 [Cichorium endivia]|nr:hypothetical protein L1887_23854 [Cichorium endivia]